MRMYIVNYEMEIVSAELLGIKQQIEKQIKKQCANFDPK